MKNKYILSILSFSMSSVTFAVPCNKGSIDEKIDCLNKHLEFAFKTIAIQNFKETEFKTKIKELETKLEDQNKINATFVAKIIHNQMPAGSVVAFAGEHSSIPNGWLLCDGRELSKADFPELAHALSKVTGMQSSYVFDPSSANFKIPDYRGLFLRGANLNRTGVFADPERKNPIIGHLQIDKFKSHTHTHVQSYRTLGIKTEIQEGGTALDQNFIALTEATGGSETRPKNIVVHYIIKT